ncbi:MAG: hypothetical protein CVU11_16940 [Bacteroidetes bacterium HGW-Bacteroidetes-6]|jgi:hypothetical protein|nr:MAG: hypothetical protein CVU11_16940 [Bacteroidetes bacterium HGW-Bacteroidetes-6]
MKYLFPLFLVTVLFLASCGNSTEQAVSTSWLDTLKELSPDDIPAAVDSQKIGFKNGVVVYESTTLGIKQEITFWFDDFGNKTRTEIKSEMMGQKMHQLSFVLDTIIYNIDMVAKEGTWNKMELDSTEELNYRNISEADKQKYNIEELPEEKILGKECNVFKMQQVSDGQTIDMKVWIWDGIPMKTESTVSGIEVSMEAKSVKVNLVLPVGIFEIPAEVKISEEALPVDSIAS